jgi:Protein of unknown function (DUF3108)
MLMNRYKKLTVLMLLSAALCVFAQLAEADELKPFVARYQVRFYGVSGGILQLTLRKGGGPNEYVYESRAEPSFLGSFMISDAARESSTMIVDDGGVRPLTFFSDDGKKGDEKDSSVRFDWERKKLTGRSERVDFDQELPERIQDHLSIQIAVIQGLLHDSPLGNFTLLDAGEVKSYVYSKEGGGTVKYKGRNLDAIIVRSERANSPGGRINRYWHVPSEGDLPMRAERSRDGKVDLTMELVDLKFTEQ